MKSEEKHERLVMFPCTCYEMPPPVTLSVSTNKNNNPNDNNGGSSDASLLLQRNLQIFGWSPIVMTDWSDNYSPQPPTRDQVLRLFHNHQHNNNSNLKYRSAESGAGGTQDVEPKESLELQLSQSTTFSNNNKEDNDKNDEKKSYKLVSVWCQAMSYIASFVCHQVLNFPTNTLLSDNPQESLDLLRVFHYHAVTITTPAITAGSLDKESESESESSTIQQRLGSSPHTDWGSWTVVWQDSVGGLETYCRSCQKWVPVTPSPPPPLLPTESSETRWQCIVHVSDMSSLALNVDHDCPEESSSSSSSSTTYPVNNNSSNKENPMVAINTTTTRVRWPSPKHRVVNSTKQDRVSLVYFGYPPGNRTLQEIQKELQNNWNQHNSFDNDRGASRRLPLQEYYLLHDQSSSTTTTIIGNNDNGDDSEEEKKYQSTYQAIQSQSIQQVIQDKWDQVQRTSY